jgi:hypothetical protein
MSNVPNENHILYFAMNSRLINNYVPSNQMMHSFQAQNQLYNSNTTRQYMTTNATQIMSNTKKTLELSKLPFNSHIRPNELTNNICNSSGCTVTPLNNGYLGQGRMCNR